MKILIKEMYETVGKDENGKAIREKIGTMYVESCRGRLNDILDLYGPEFVENLIDDQVLHHPASAAFKAKGKRGDAEGLDKLDYAAKPSRQLYRTPMNKIYNKIELEPGQALPADMDEHDVVMVNWAFKPGVSVAAAAKEAAIQKNVETQIELLVMDGREITPELRAKVEAFVRSKA